MRIPSLARSAAATLAAAACLAAAQPSVALAQLPGGVSPDVLMSMLPSQISVPAGETTSVDVGVPVNVSYSADGWVVSSQGTVVSVTAPDTPGATASVPASAGGYSATVTLVAEGSGGQAAGQQGGEGAAAPAGNSAGAGDGAGDGSAAPGERPAGEEPGNSGSGEGAKSGAVEHPPRKAASPVERQTAKRFAFDGEIRGNQLVVKVPLSKAKDLLNYANVDTENATLRYVDVNGQIIEGVTRDINVAGRTLTLTYPEGETPDNPFIMEVVRDGAAEFIAVITATNAPVEQAQDATDSPYREEAERSGQGEGVDTESSIRDVLPLVVGVTALLTALALAALLLVRRRRGRG